MKCPRTGTDLQEIEVGGIKVDLSEACGGVWLDNYELEKFDEQHEAAGEELAAMMDARRSDAIDLSQRLHSPRHPEIVMVRHFFSVRRQVEIDECPMSGGIWLDAGELTQIRALFPTEEARRAAGEAFVEEVFQRSGLPEQLARDEAFLRKSQQIAHLLRWICPRHYLPRPTRWIALGG